MNTNAANGAYDRASTPTGGIVKRRWYYIALCLAWAVLFAALYVGATP